MLRLGIPTGWNDVIIRSLKVLLVSFLVFLLKEFIEVGRTDIPAGSMDALWVAGGVFLFNAVLMLAAPRTAR